MINRKLTSESNNVGSSLLQIYVGYLILDLIVQYPRQLFKTVVG